MRATKLLTTQPSPPAEDGTVLHLDTHVLVWLYGGERQRVPRRVQQRIDRESLAISPMVELELAYLHELGRLRVSPDVVLDEVVRGLDVRRSAASFATVVREARRLVWTRDPFDRVIAAQAIVDGATLVTSDERMLEHVAEVLW